MTNADGTIPILIIGGGIGGMAAALALARAGFPAHVVEQAPEFTEIGAGLQLAPNALRVLEGLGVMPALDEVAVKPRNLVFMHADTGEHLTTIDFGKPFRRRYGQSYTVMHRNDLLDVLLSACRDHDLVTLENNRQVEDVQDLGGGALVRFADGDTYRCGAVVGADGLWSRTRRLLADDRPIADTYVAYRGALPVAEITAPVEADDEIIWIGPHKHLVQYPIRRGELYNQVAVFRSRRYTPEDEFTDRWGVPAELDEHFASSCEPVKAAISLFNRDRRWVMYDREPLDNWTRGRVTLLGDAAHPMVQYLAQGACQAIEDAGCLARQFAAHGGDVDKAFAAYQAERIPRSALVQRVARGWGRVWHDNGDVIPVLRDRLFARRSPDDYTDLDWLYQPVSS
ncbi:3-hydroxybenzoate 6-hydroxylase 1 [Actinomadura rubteroloni]|uniref:3-hydroxybenzoate 6-hydroxylase 1 n=1 Tax=Actinomadura rubteroloni TaxID=1926885 RepID=A0A2P4UDR3_9ACTN|nr:FAD-dependent monooxygenase [Actinomadura rubteroloni]POM23172.1 3-hydroxybenzoate 6-hydroxylase 1 [Actinomadura rubteroloni]